MEVFLPSLASFSSVPEDKLLVSDQSSVMVPQAFAWTSLFLWSLCHHHCSSQSCLQRHYLPLACGVHQALRGGLSSCWPSSGSWHQILEYLLGSLQWSSFGVWSRSFRPLSGLTPIPSSRAFLRMSSLMRPLSRRPLWASRARALRVPRRFPWVP